MTIYVLHNNVSSSDVGYFSSEQKARDWVIADSDDGKYDEMVWSIWPATVDNPEADRGR